MSQVQVKRKISLSDEEVTYLRELARAYKALAESERNQIKRQRWYDINDLKEGAVPVFMSHYWQISTKEILPDEALKCSSEKGQYFERYLRERMFFAEELDDDNVLEPVIYSKMVFAMEDYEGFERKIHKTQDHGGAYEMVPVLIEDGDIEKLKKPVLHYDEKASYDNYLEAVEIFQPTLKVIKEPFTRAAKIADEYSWLRGMESTYMDMYDRPEWMHDALGRITDNFEMRFKQWEDSGIWGTLDMSLPLGSAGLRYVSGKEDFRTVDKPFDHKVKVEDSWGFTCAEVFNCVSNQMHDEFSFDYDKRIMDRFKFINVGCCEVLDKKVELCQKLVNTRKVSISEWCDHEVAAEAIGGDYVYSYRAAGVPFIREPWDRKTAEAEIRSVLEASMRHGCKTEIVLNIGGTLGKDPQKKAIEWSKMVRDLIEEYYPEAKI